MNKKLSFGRRAYIYGMKALMYASTAAIGALVLFLIGYVLYRGIPNITWEFLTTAPSILNDTIGIWPDILNSIYVVIATIIIVLPLGVCAAIYLSEYASNKKLVRVIEYAAETLSGIPSIIYGLVGMLFFCEFLKMQTSLMAGALTLVIMNLPTVMRTTQESLKTVPQSYREGAFGLGAGKWRVIRTVVLPGCVDNSLGVLDWVAEHFRSGDILFSLMSQYVPMGRAAEMPPFDRRITELEYDSVLSYMMLLGIEDGYTQDFSSAERGYTPSFDLTGL